MTAVTRQVTLEHLDLAPRSYREQHNETIISIPEQVFDDLEGLYVSILDSTMLQASMQCRELRKYHDSWPVARYMHIYLKNYHPKRQKAKAGPGANRHTAATPVVDCDDAIRRFLSNLRIPGRDAERIATLFRDMDIETQDYLEIVAAMESRKAWLQELAQAGNLTRTQIQLLQEGLDRLCIK
ncbi:hypothetical protein BD414DRAFT_547082 [Trametes punicea]|nr:hypothetical protein BD414DRAFT_547082 [Trametes punicea]